MLSVFILLVSHEQKKKEKTSLYSTGEWQKIDRQNTVIKFQA